MVCPHITEDEYRKRFEGNINDWQEPLHTSECRSDVDFFKEYASRTKDIKPVRGILEVIKNLERAYTLIIISSTITDPIQEFLERYGAAQYFTQIMGNDVHASKVEKIKMIFSKYGASSNQYVFITDTLGDMKEASRMGIGTVGVGWGFQSKETLLGGNPFRIVESPEELLTVIPTYFENSPTKAP